MARRRGRDTQVASGPGTRACPLCGEVVPVGEDGRCDLGHRVFTPATTFEQTEPLSHVDVVPPDAGAVDVPAAPIAGLAAAGLALADTVPLEEAERDEPVAAEPAAEEPDEDEPLDFSAELDW